MLLPQSMYDRRGSLDLYVAPGLPPSEPGARPQNLVQFAGLTPGLVGTYQIDFQVPVPEACVAGCTTVARPNLSLRVQSSIETLGVLDSVQIPCRTRPASLDHFRHSRYDSNIWDATLGWNRTIVVRVEKEQRP